MPESLPHQPTFSVVAMVRETEDVLRRFAVHYLALGAEEVRFFFDGEASEVPPLDMPGVRITVCDKAFWEARLGYKAHSMRDTHNGVYRAAVETGVSDWQFFCDADEFLVSEMPVADLLARAPDDCDTVRVMNCEAVWGPGDTIGEPFGCTYFRTVLGHRKESLWRVLLPGRPRAFFRNGLVGHGQGKHFLRRGAATDTYNCHTSLRDGQEVGLWAHDLGYDTDTVFVAHFDAVSERRWIEKWRRRLSHERPSFSMGSQRKAQAEAVARAEATGRLSDLFRQLYSVSAYETAVLRLLNGIKRRHVFPSDP